MHALHTRPVPFTARLYISIAVKPTRSLGQRVNSTLDLYTLRCFFSPLLRATAAQSARAARHTIRCWLAR